MSLPKTSSLPIKRISLSKSFKACNTATYAPIETDGDPFSICHMVALETPALSAVKLTLIPLLNLANFI